MMNFLAQVSAPSNENIAIGVGGGGAFLFVIKVGGDLFKTWILERTKMGTKIKNGSGCKMTSEAVGVIVSKDSKDRYRTHFQAEEVKEQHQKQDLTQKEISDTLLKVAQTLDIMERRMK